MYILKDYDLVLKKLLDSGFSTPSRAGNTKSLMGVNCRYDISEYFPIPTKRKAFYKSIFAELLWMISGSTNVNDLNKLGSKIWDSWKDSEFEKRNNYKDGDLGPIYGHSFTNFGGDYNSNTGFNQIKYLINELKSNKYSRRALINLWDPAVMTTDKVKLPACHYSFQIVVDNNDNATGILTQRSGDWLPGVSANIYFYSAFLYMICQQVNLKPYELVHNIGNAHIYENQIDAANQYLLMSEINSPKLILHPAKDIFSYTLDNFEVINYSSGPVIKFPIAL